MNTIHETIPYYDEYNRVYVFSSCREMNEIEYMDWRNKLRSLSEEQYRQADFEFKCKVYEATALMEDMMNGYAPSIAYSRAFRRNNIKFPTM